MQIGVDIGGTFTDIVALDAEGRLVLTKVPSHARRTCSRASTLPSGACSRSPGAPASAVERFIHGTTVATNAVLEQKGAVTAILTTEGFEDVLEMGRQKRSRMYDLDMDPETPTFVAPAAPAHRHPRAAGRARRASSCRSTRRRSAPRWRALTRARRAGHRGLLSVLVRRSAARAPDAGDLPRGRARRSACRCRPTSTRPSASTSASASPRSTPIWARS